MKKRHPRLPPSDRRRLAFDNLYILSGLRLGEVVLFRLPGPLLAFSPLGLLSFTGAFPADITGAILVWVRYFSLNFVFTVLINSTRLRSHLLWASVYKALAFCSIPCHFALVWFQKCI
jgi:hypothetical protein